MAYRTTVFENRESYVRVTVESFKRRARCEDYDRATRVEFAAMAWANRHGHAGFPRGELAKILAVGGKIPSASTVANAIRTAKDRGGIGDESNARCLVVRHSEVNQGQGTYGCLEHGIFRP